MIMVNVSLNEHKKIKKVKVSGHSGYDEIGKDIVCSAVSTAMYVSVGMIVKMNLDYDFKSYEKNATMELAVNNSTEYTDAVLENLVEILEGISQDYPKNLKIKTNK